MTATYLLGESFAGHRSGLVGAVFSVAFLTYNLSPLLFIGRSAGRDCFCWYDGCGPLQAVTRQLGVPRSSMVNGVLRWRKLTWFDLVPPMSDTPRHGGCA